MLHAGEKVAKTQTRLGMPGVCFNMADVAFPNLSETIEDSVGECGAQMCIVPHCILVVGKPLSDITGGAFVSFHQCLKILGGLGRVSDDGRIW